MKYISSSLFFISLIVPAQDISTELLKTLSPEEVKQLYQSREAEKFSKDEPGIPTLEDKEEESLERIPEDIPENEKIFGLDFIKTFPTSISATTDLPFPGEYVVSVNDELRAILSGTKSNIFELRVGMDGSLFFPDLGSLNVAGLTLNQVKDTLRKWIGEKYVGVDIDISLVSVSAKKISIIGAVESPGSYLVNPFTTISNALSYSGGIKEYGSLRNIIVQKIDGKVINFDLYDLLIRGNRKNDIVLSPGDTVIIEGTTNHVKIDGAVIRPMVYEYSEKDSIEDLIQFALSFAKDANKENIFAVKQASDRIFSERVGLKDKVGSEKFEALHIGNFSKSQDLDLFISGAAANSGYYNLPDDNIPELIKTLDYGDNIYPYFALFIKDLGKNKGKEIFSFSILDELTYSNFSSSTNSELIFFERNEILELSEFLLTPIEKEDKAEAEPEKIQALNNANLQVMKEQPIQEEKTIKEETATIDSIIGIEEEYITNNLVQLRSPDKSFIIPIAGSFKPSELQRYLSIFDENILKQQVSAVYQDFTQTEVYTKEINSKNLISLVFPQDSQEKIEVEIVGEVRSPGLYTVSSSTSLLDLYRLVGGFTDIANPKGIFFQRQDIKEKELIAIRQAKQILTEDLIQKTATSGGGQAPSIEFLQLADQIEPTGRLAGDFAPSNSDIQEIFLKNKDKITVPAISNEIVIQGEVLNPSTTKFQKGLNYNDYIQSAGGLTKNADKNGIYVIKSNGVSYPIQRNVFSSNIDIEKGDIIVVPRDINRIEALPLVSLATQIISDLAIAAASLNAIQR